MNSLLALALAAQVVVANPLVRRQVTSSRATATTPVETAFTTTVAEVTESASFLTPTETFTLSDTPTPTAGGSDGSYWFCSFPGSSEPTGTYSLPETTDFPTETITASFPEITDSVTVIESDPVTETDTDTDTESLLFKRQATTTRTASQVTVTSFVETATLTTDVLTDTLTDISSDPFPVTSDFPTITATATAPSNGWVSTYTIVGPETTAVIECVRIPGRGGHHHGRPPHYPPHHGTGPVTWSGPVATTGTFTFNTDTVFPTETLTDGITLSSAISSLTTSVSAATSTTSV